MYLCPFFGVALHSMLPLNSEHYFECLVSNWLPTELGVLFSLSADIDKNTTKYKQSEKFKHNKDRVKNTWKYFIWKLVNKILTKNGSCILCAQSKWIFWIFKWQFWRKPAIGKFCIHGSRLSIFMVSNINLDYGD